MNIAIPTTFSASTVARSAEVNANFAEIATKFNTYAVQTDVSRTITAPQTFAADLLFTDALYDLGKSGATRPRDGFFSRNVTVGGALAGASAVLGTEPAGGHLSVASRRTRIAATSSLGRRRRAPMSSGRGSSASRASSPCRATSSSLTRCTTSARAARPGRATGSSPAT
jgi:hypothetical protein